MPLQAFVQEQLDRLAAFVKSPAGALHVVRCDPDVKPLLRRLLLRLDEELEDDVLLALPADFQDEDQYFTRLVEALGEQAEPCREELAAAGVALPPPPEARAGADPETRFHAYAAAVADALPEWFGALVLILDPETVADQEAFGRSAARLPQRRRSRKVRFLLVDDRQAPRLGGLESVPSRPGAAVTSQAFYLAPDEIERRVNRELAEGKARGPERRRYLAMAGAFAAAHGRLEEAEQRQREALHALREDDAPPGEQAVAWYNLGDTLLKQQRLAEAEQAYAEAAALCLEHELHPLLAATLANLGVALHRQGRVEESLQSLETARRTFAALNNPPGEAYALDAKAAVLAAEGRRQEAEAAWRDALARYENIANPAFDEVRDGGRRDILEKLKRFLNATGQAAKVRELEQKEAAP